MRALLLASAAIAVATPALALVDPPRCSETGDPRVRCVQYDPNEVYRIPVRFNAHVLIVFAPGSTVLDPASALVETLKRDGNGNAVKPRDWQGVWDSNTLHLQPLRYPMNPTAMTVPLQMRGGRVLDHAFELVALDEAEKRGVRLATQAEIDAEAAKAAEADGKERGEARRAQLESANRDTIIMVRFAYTPQQDPPPAPPPPAPRPATVAAIPAVAEAPGAFRPDPRSALLAGQLRADPFCAHRDCNVAYIARGSQEVLPLEISDNGLDTVARFDPALPMPNVYRTESGECDGPKAEALVTRDVLGPGLIRIHGTHPVLCFRRTNDKAAQVRNLGFNPYGSNPGTGTISPNVIRTVRRGPRS